MTEKINFFIVSIFTYPFTDKNRKNEVSAVHHTYTIAIIYSSDLQNKDRFDFYKPSSDYFEQLC